MNRSSKFRNCDEQKQRFLNAGIQAEKSNQEAMLVRNKSTIAALSELMKDTAFVKHRKTLDEVATAVTRAIESDYRWSTKCQKLQTEVAANESKLAAAMKTSEEDKVVIEALKSELLKQRNVIEELKKQGNSRATQESPDDAQQRTKGKICKTGELFGEGDTNKDSYDLKEEIERGKLQIFELEEELTNKEKHIEELTGALNTKSQLYDEIVSENEKLKIAVEKSADAGKMLTNQNQSCQICSSDLDPKSNKTISALKKKVLDMSKRDELSQEKVKHLIKNNKATCRQLQMATKQNNLLKLELAEQSKMLNLLAGQCCKLEEKDKKHSITIKELHRIRDKYVHMIGNLEQEIHDMKKKKLFL